MMASETNSELDQLKMGAAVVGICIAQILAEEDPQIALRLHDRALLWYEQLSNRGNMHAAEIIYMFASAITTPGATSSGPAGPGGPTD
jgi:hypothetical protein